MACNSEIVIPNPGKPAIAVIKAADEVKKQLEDLVGCKFAIYEVKSYREYVNGATTYYFIQVQTAADKSYHIFVSVTASKPVELLMYFPDQDPAIKLPPFHWFPLGPGPVIF